MMMNLSIIDKLFTFEEDNYQSNKNNARIIIR